MGVLRRRAVSGDTYIDQRASGWCRPTDARQNAALRHQLGVLMRQVPARVTAADGQIVLHRRPAQQDVAATRKACNDPNVGNDYHGAMTRPVSPQGDLQPPDRQLEEARQEQSRLVREFAQEHSRSLLRLATRLVGGNDAEDVAQEAFVDLARRIKNRPAAETMALLESPEALSRLMYRITACRAYDHLRRLRRNAIADRSVDAETVVDQPPPHRAEIDVRRVEYAYAALPPAQRVAHVLHHYYGFTDADMEATLGISKVNSRTLVRRANLALKRAMENVQ